MSDLHNKQSPSPQKGAKTKEAKFTSYEILVLVFLMFLQITVVIDFVVISPLGVLIIDDLKVNAAQFGEIVSAYAFAAGISAFLCSSFSDRFDRKKLLLVFYCGFLVGTLLCGLSTNYLFLVLARIVTGFFGGVIGSITLAIVTDLFNFERRGLVMGMIQSAFAASQILGIPLGIFFGSHFGWQSVFWVIVVVGSVVGFMIYFYLRPIVGHLAYVKEKNLLKNLQNTLTNRSYWNTYAAVCLVTVGAFMVMPFSSAFMVKDLGLTIEQLTYVYVFTGLISLIFGPVIGRLSDRYGKFPFFVVGSVITIAMVLVFTNLHVLIFANNFAAYAFAVTLAINGLVFLGMTCRIVTLQALNTAMPSVSDRGGFMNINSGIQMLSGGFASFVAGHLVTLTPDGRVSGFYRIGLVVASASLITLANVYYVNKRVKAKLKHAHPTAAVTQLEF